MPIQPRPVFTEQLADTDTPFDVTLAVAATAEDLVTVPATKLGRTISLVNEGPGDIALKADATATTSDLLIKEGEAYSETRLKVSTKLSFINVTATVLPRVRGVLWSGD